MEKVVGFQTTLGKRHHTYICKVITGHRDILELLSRGIDCILFPFFYVFSFSVKKNEFALIFPLIRI